MYPGKNRRSFRAVSEPEVGFEDITIDLPEARFWIASELPTILPEL
jgi:hypothetical protein